MDLASVQALKAELREARRGLSSVAWSGSLAWRSGSLALGGGARPGAVVGGGSVWVRCALGVAAGVGSRDFRLGVRIHEAGRVGSVWRDEIIRRTRGECDVRCIAVVEAQAKPAPYFQKRRRPLVAGASVAYYAASAGSLGFIVEDDDAHYILSNNHVLAGLNTAHGGDPIVQPAPHDALPSQRNVVGELDRFVPLSFRRLNLVDCALARLLPGLKFFEGWSEAIGGPGGEGGRVSGVRRLTPRDLGRVVTKAGRTTGVTSGTVQLVDLDDLEVNLGSVQEPRVAMFRDQIEIAGAGQVFSRNGDSGAVVLDAAGYAVGLLFAGSDYSYANHMDEVLRLLGVSLVL